ncbi:cell division protein [Mucilaginibacter limnophilus]|uniref:Cell division protein n=1 Tax=Mucilaginibacter limnophilus TaxID=1932778 RepID=A0A3S2UPV0_9SPHI|nr:SRPBCC family protein [Mucilaginibacter limnophilus]RVU01466.1 cell division protein [Mucilaginibacter limnophilus]
MKSIIKLTTIINAPAETVFDLSRSIDLHIESTKHTGEKAIAGRTSGLIQMGESVTWQAKHFGIVQQLTSKITEFDRPRYFVDEMVKGAFKSFRHEHRFMENNGQTVMTDIFIFEAPFGWIGAFFSKLILKKYMTNLLAKRNAVIKSVAEAGNKF